VNLQVAVVVKSLALFDNVLKLAIKGDVLNVPSGLKILIAVALVTVEGFVVVDVIGLNNSGGFKVDLLVKIVIL
jgi:hypothetical protein